MPLKPPHDALRLEVQHNDHSVQSPDCQVVTRKEPSRVEAGAEAGDVDGGVEVLGERGREGVCRSSESARHARTRTAGRTEEFEVH